MFLLHRRLRLSLYLRVELLLLIPAVGKLFREKKYRASLHPQDIFLGPLMLNLARPKGFLIWVTGIASLHLQSLFLPPYQHQLLMF
jgi:hypothetical protein